MRRIEEYVPVSWNGRHFRTRGYGSSDEPKILDHFFFWKMTAVMAGFTDDKKPQMPETFSERYCCLVCGLLHNLERTGPDAFVVDTDGRVESAVEIKGTITKGGFTSVGRSLNFDDLYWLSFASYDSLRYKICRIKKPMIQQIIRRSRFGLDRGTVNLKRIVDRFELRPTHVGYIGTVPEDW